MTPLLRRFALDDAGSTAIEYAVIASVVSIVVTFGLANLGTATSNLYDFLVDHLVTGDGAD